MLRKLKIRIENLKYKIKSQNSESSLTFSNMVWITNPDVGEQRRRKLVNEKTKEIEGGNES